MVGRDNQSVENSQILTNREKDSGEAIMAKSQTKEADSANTGDWKRIRSTHTMNPAICKRSRNASRSGKVIIRNAF